MKEDIIPLVDRADIRKVVSQITSTPTSSLLSLAEIARVDAAAILEADFANSFCLGATFSVAAAIFKLAACPIEAQFFPPLSRQRALEA